MGIDNDTERRRSSIPVEKMSGLVISGAALAFGVYSAGSAYLDGIRSDIDAVALVQADLVARLESYYREREPWIERIRLLESRCNEVRERLGAEPHR